MSVIVTDTGFQPDDWTAGFAALADFPAADASVHAVELKPADRAEDLADHIARIDMVRVLFPAFSDGRGFTLARRLRAMGYQGRLRAAGHVLADQYAMARRCGFDEVEISDDLAARQPQEQWVSRAGWDSHFYQGRLRA